MYTRRTFGKTLLATLPLGALSLAEAQTRVARFSSRFGGVRIGAQTYCYRSLRDAAAPWTAAGVDSLLDRVVDAFVANRIDLAEFWIALVEPPGGPGRGPTDPVMREALRKWRQTRPLDVFERARRKFTDAGIEICSCMFNFADDLADDELEFAFDVARTLGTGIISANCTRPSPWMSSGRNGAVQRTCRRFVSRCKRPSS